MAVEAGPRPRGPSVAGWVSAFALLIVAANAVLWSDPRLAAEIDKRLWLPSGAGAMPLPASTGGSTTSKPSAGSSMALESELARAHEEIEGGRALRKRVLTLEAELEDQREVGEGLRGRVRELEESLAAAQAGTLDGSAHASKVQDTTGTQPLPSRKDSASTGEPSWASFNASGPLGGSISSRDSAPTAETSTASFSTSRPLGGSDASKETTPKAEPSVPSFSTSGPLGCSEARRDIAPKAETYVDSSQASRPTNGSVLAAPLREEVALLTRDSPGYDGFRRMAMKLAGMRANATMRALEEQDPFGVRGFERRLVERELLLNRTLEHGELAELFPCPAPEDRITRPEQMSVANAEMFRNGTNGSFLFFQHMSKAAGTLFCKLAQANLPKEAVPQYFCMPDVTWLKNTSAHIPYTKGALREGLTRKGACAGCLGRWNNSEIAVRMLNGGHRIACNEWDPFDERFLQLEAVFAVVLRRPTDRAISHYRFFVLEQPNSKKANFSTYWSKSSPLDNYYVRKLTKVDYPEPRPLPKNKIAWRDIVARRSVRMKMMPSLDRAARLASALDVVVRFHAVLVTEWLAYAGPLLQRVLGFGDAKPLVRETLPPQNKTLAVLVRPKKHPRAHLGAALFYHGAENLKAREYLGEELFQTVQEDLAVDEILTDAGKRVFLERTVCGSG